MVDGCPVLRLADEARMRLWERSNGSGRYRPGDWWCENCNELVFSSRTTCRLCRAPRAVVGGPASRHATPFLEARAREMEASLMRRTHARSGAARTFWDALVRVSGFSDNDPLRYHAESLRAVLDLWSFWQWARWLPPGTL